MLHIPNLLKVQVWNTKLKMHVVGTDRQFAKQLSIYFFHEMLEIVCKYLNANNSLGEK